MLLPGSNICSVTVTRNSLSGNSPSKKRPSRSVVCSTIPCLEIAPRHWLVGTERTKKGGGGILVSCMKLH